MYFMTHYFITGCIETSPDLNSKLKHKDEYDSYIVSTDRLH